MKTENILIIAAGLAAGYYVGKKKEEGAAVGYAIGAKSFKNMAELKAANRDIGNFFFSTGAMKFFKSKIESGLLDNDYFITSEVYGEHNPRMYHIRKANPDGSITNNPFGTKSFSSKESAKEYIKSYGSISGMTCNAQYAL